MTASVSIEFRRTIKNTILMVLGVLSAGLGLKGFLLPSNFLDGGVMGISLLIENLTDVNLAILVVIINIPFIIIGYRQVSRWFAFKTLIAIALLAICLSIVPYPVITADKLLISVFGGFFLGAGIGLTMRGGCVLDGTEVFAIYLSKNTSLSVGDIIMMVNIIIFSFAAFLINIETALYAILTYLSASKTVDFIINGLEEYTAMTIISDRSEQIKQVITKELGMGVTVYKGERGFKPQGTAPSSMDLDILYCIVTRLEISKVKAEIEKIDEQAFIILHSINDTKGGMIKKRTFH
ncbi:Uncharacterized membrane-anchored protein YitT, contains DUF161 and DUF2179 domains [Flexibacter flexilis DSM 6793]|uniref:Uncharacterized membrane-anchored protein YitT, contains DUF161 and DUF2179 domains n=1 Tax=Flexibacter flexilis DSM 6793 TaxID=927664 RepID=A0A1I1G103_9BACT|nr:YitT family protein [Flexibacter flexilis]SFC05006.1 Uncharacterized membrane-anchored protein YitT, contains DUF161 and DUF2179 domains [Flexibacter flexilis DSM 6793]